ncbi:hypothetical protein MHYP_G00109290 [Metynnis hypsauchen]
MTQMKTSNDYKHSQQVYFKERKVLSAFKSVKKNTFILLCYIITAQDILLATYRPLVVCSVYFGLYVMQIGSFLICISTQSKWAFHSVFVLANQIIRSFLLPFLVRMKQRIL